jgi:hypothetical protein
MHFFGILQGKKILVGLSLKHLFGCLQAENFISADEFIGSWMVA